MINKTTHNTFRLFTTFVILLLISAQVAVAQIISNNDITRKLDIDKEEISLSLPVERIPESSTCTWKVDDKEVTDGFSNGKLTITLPLSNKSRKVEVSITSADNNSQTLSKTIEPLVYGNVYDGNNFFADSYEPYPDGTFGGSKEKPYLISNDMQLAKLAHDVNIGKSTQMYSGVYFKLTKDIDLSKGIWTPIGSTDPTSGHFFAGKFDGDGHTISNMQINWSLKTGSQASWGLFSRMNGKDANKEGMATVTNLIIDEACIAKEEGHMPLNHNNSLFVKLGIIAADLTQNSEVSNIIIRNSKITDDGYKYGNLKTKFRIGGIVGYLENGLSCRIFNISSQTEIDMLTNATLTNGVNQATISGGIGSASRLANVTGDIIWPQNIFVHGNGIKANSNTTNCKKANVIAFIATNNFSNTCKDTWYYTPANNFNDTSDDNKFGTEKDITDITDATTGKTFGKEFAELTNKFINDNGLDRKTWAYSDTNQEFSFSSIMLKWTRGESDVITVVTGDGKESADKYNWYVSRDNTVGEKINEEACNPFPLPRQTYDQYIYAQTTDGAMRTNSILVPAINVSAKLDAKTKPGTYIVDVTNDSEEHLSNSNLGLNITYEWYNGTTKLNVSSNSYERPATATHKDKYSCKVTVKSGETVLLSKVLNATVVVYLCPADITINDKTYNQGQDNITNEEWGYSPDQPMKTWQGAYKKLTAAGTWNENVIVLMGTSNINNTNYKDNGGFNITSNYTGTNILNNTDWQDAKQKYPEFFRNTTITGKWDGTDYNGTIEIFGAEKGLPIWGDTRFENITFNNNGGDAYKNIYCQYNNLEMGEGIVMTGFHENANNYGTIEGAVTTAIQIFGGIHNDGRFYPMGKKENIKAFAESMPHGKEGFKINILSGFYSIICVGGRQTSDNNSTLNGVMGTPNLPIKCTITMDIDRLWNDKHNDERDVKIKYADSNTTVTETRKNDYDVGVILAGNHEGAMYGDVDIVIKSGKVARVVNGTLGAERKFTFEYNNKTYTAPYNSFMGRANITLDPAKSENNKDTNINNRIIVTELYGGSTGRGHTGNITINNPFYGYSNITINGGTFKILPEGNTRKDYIFSGIYGAGAGGMNGIGYGDDKDNTHTTDQNIPYWNDSEEVMLYGPYSEAKDKLIKYKCYNAERQDYTFVDPQLTNTQIVINDGVFGSANESIDGIYAGGSGYMSRGLWTATSAIPNSTGGNVYGKEGTTAVSLTINGGEFYCDKGIFAGGRGTDYYYHTTPYGGTASDYKALGQTYGNVELNISGGIFHCSVFGGGYGVGDAIEMGKTKTETETLSEMARVYGQSFVNISGGTFYKNIYGGGDMAVIEFDGDATNVAISDSADIRGSVFAGGNGRPLRPENIKNTNYAEYTKYTQKPETVGLVKGNTNIFFSGNSQLAPHIYGDIFGGGNLAQVSKDTYVNIYAGNFAGQIFGGGNGNINGTTITSADVLGNTNVALAHDQGGQVTRSDGAKEDNFSINVIWNKKWDGKDIITWNPKDGSNREQFYDYDDTSNKEHFLNPHNIYGGGNLACNVKGKATLEIQKGMTPYALLTTAEWKAAYDNNDNPHFSVFGGGYGKNTTVGSTDVTVNVDGDYGDYKAEVEDSTDQLVKPFRKAKSKRAVTKGTSLSNDISANKDISVFDDSRGVPNFTIWAVLGGGYAGTVIDSTKVTVDGKTFIHRVFGGGFGDPTSTEDNTTGQIGGNTKVYVMGANIYGDVFGGGAGVKPKKDTSGNYTYFTKVACVVDTTMVEVSDDAKIYGNVYGGGDNANVGEASTSPSSPSSPSSSSPSSLSSVSTLAQSSGAFLSYQAQGYRSFVNICGGNIFGEVFGGGKGIKKAEAEAYDQVGRINGNTLVHIVNSMPGDDNNRDNIVPYVWNNVYGGCAYGTVDGSTLVHIEGGMLGNNIFGGGYGDVNIDNKNTSTDEVLGKKDTDNKGTYANILGNTKVQVDGGSWIWNRKADINGNISTWTAADDDSERVCNSKDDYIKMAIAITNASSLDDVEDSIAKAVIKRIKNDKSTKEFFDIDKCIFTQGFNIFGGGNRACYVGKYNAEGSLEDKNTGKATVIVNHSPLDDIADSKNKTISMFDQTSLQAMCWLIGSTDISNPQFSVFGAGYGANTKVGSTEVYAQPGTKVGDDGILTINGIKYRYLNQPKDYQTYIKVEKDIYDDFKRVSPEDKKLYYGSYDGTDKDPNVYRRYHISRLSWLHGAPGIAMLQVHGGGYAGYVSGDTYVETDCQLYCHDIYGAGLGAKPYGNYANGDSYDFGTVGGKSRVFVKSGYVDGNVYGGGAGIESIMKDGVYIDFPKMAHVNNTEVHIYGRNFNYKLNLSSIDRTLILGSVYGGGDVANVGNSAAAPTAFKRNEYIAPTNRTTLVNIRGGAIMAQVFAGGKGRLKTECNDYTKLGGVYGNTCLIIDRPVISYPYWDDSKKEFLSPSTDANMAHPDDKTNVGIIPTLAERIIGGCQNGTVYGNTLMTIYSGRIAHGCYAGGWGYSDTLSVDGKETVIVTSANVTGNTNMFIRGGEALLASYWEPVTRSWVPASIIDGIIYFPQYNHDALKFKVNHNIYGGGNEACVVGGNTYITMEKGMLNKDIKMVFGREDGKTLFESDEWKEIYYKVGSPHFSIFGGGYGEHTKVKGDTYVNIAMEGRKSIHHGIDIEKGKEYKHFYSNYSVMDIVGGGYSGEVCGTTHIVGAGGVFCRRVFGGGFYSSVDSTDVEIRAIDCSDVVGGGFMGDIKKGTNVRIGLEDTSSEKIYNNADIYIHGSIYGGNDVSGYVNLNDTVGYFKDNGGSGTNIDIFGGHIFGNVYGAGNGNYLYANDRNGNTKVTVNEHYPLDPKDPNSQKVPLVYTVPMRHGMGLFKAASDAAKLVNINSWRPLTNKVKINIKGNSSEDAVRIDGSVYGGGNSATVQKIYDEEDSDKYIGDIKINIGSNVRIEKVFMGSNGDELFTETNDFMNLFQRLNSDASDYTKELDLADTIDWINDPSNKTISTLYLPTEKAKRPLVYPHLIDLYFKPVETDIQAKLTWNGSREGEGLTNCVIGTFCCGGNHGNMNVVPNADGNVVDYIFPKGLTITDKIVGGCNKANYDYRGKVSHEGGYLLGLGYSKYPFIKLTVRNKFEPKVVNEGYVGGNVYGGCYETGTIKGDVTILLESDMLANKDKTKLKISNDLLAMNPIYSALNVYGAGYGMESYVYGNTHIVMGESIKCSEPKMDGNIFKPCGVADSKNNPDGLGVSANFVYGGGQKGNVIGVTNVDILNGHVFRSVTGGSYSGYVYGSTQVKVGYPTYYHVNSDNHVSGRYELNRADKKNLGLMNTDGSETTPTIKQHIYLLSDELLTQGTYEEVVAIDNGHDKKTIKQENKDTYFTKVEAKMPKVGWYNVNINIDEAVYGGGYSLAQGSSVMANNTTVLKFNNKYNIDNQFQTTAADIEELKGLPNGSTAGFGGNTVILVGDSKDKEHITISHQDMEEVKQLPAGTDLFGYYYKHYNDLSKDEYTYRYISLQDKYFYTPGNVPSGLVGIQENKFYKYDSEGGIFGDGHLSYAQGFRSADVTGYGFANHTINDPKIINTFQRLDILRLEDNCFSLLGARDYTVNEINKTPYSISRVGEIKMVAQDIALDNGNLQAKPATGGAIYKYGVKARNYMGLSNNIHYVSAVTSNVDFNSKNELWRNGHGKIAASDDEEDKDFIGKTYQEVKQKYIDDYLAEKDKNENGGDPFSKFQKRNNGTAKNMIGIASGYAMKIKLCQEVYDTLANKVTEKEYFGPIYGVVEMELINVREDEGGGYVYADNNHKRDDGKEEDFLETTGNFVFPYADGQYIVDDCFPTGYYALENSGQTADSMDVHYWYVTGFHYYYNAHITGYTFNSSKDNPISFHSDNKDGLTVLAGLKSGQNVKIHSWKMRSGHPENKDEYSSDLEYRNYLTGTETDADAKNYYSKQVTDGYRLYVGGSGSNTFAGATSTDDADKTEKGFSALLPMKKEGDIAPTIFNATLPTGLNEDAKISFNLVDMVDNTNNTEADYFNKHLAQKSLATLVIKAPAYEEYKSETDNKPLYRKTSKFFKKDGDKYVHVTEGTLEKNNTYYQSQTDEFVPVEKLYSLDNSGNYSQIDIKDITIDANHPTTYYVPREYTYTIYLTIDYVQGPTVSGNITIENCALPGEMIRIRKNKVTIEADESFAANGYYWHIGKLKRGDNGKLTTEFDETTSWLKDTSTENTYKQGTTIGKDRNDLFAGGYYDKTDDYLEIPVYYFMNGYGVQLAISMTGFDKQLFTVPVQLGDTLVVHNYQEMDPHSAKVDLHIPEAIARAKAEPKYFAQPRIYIKDQRDLAAFNAFIEKVSNDGGKYAQFILQNDLTMDNIEGSNATFKGLFHGNGHVLKGFDKNKALFAENQGQIYNLGLENGNIAANGSTNGGAYHCCFELNPSLSPSSSPSSSEASSSLSPSSSEASSSLSDGVSTPFAPIVYRIDGSADTHYTSDDFKYGKVAYDLNEYYLRARYSNDASSPTDMEALKYVYDYYANGDYQYAHRADSITGNTTGITYLRTGDGNINTPNYGSYLTRHNQLHPIDKARIAPSSASSLQAPSSSSSFGGVSTPLAYVPLFNTNHADPSGANDMNDFLFWGQSLQGSPANYPASISSRQISYMTNRVYRTAKYDGDTKIAAFHYNAYKGPKSQWSTYVYFPTTTAIDFTCQNDIEKNMNNITADGISQRGIFYPPVDDNATVFNDLILKDGVTKNLLVYTAADNKDESVKTEAYDIVFAALNYDEDKKETDIKGHHIFKNEDGSSFITPFLHLVERTPKGTNSEGNSCANNDFCVPIPFNVTKRAWYVRKPMYYANESTGAWEGICLPFTVDKAEASLNGEITHFYGTPTEEELSTPSMNTHTLHHEYWLRGLTSIEQADTKPAAIFKRPGATKDGLFMPTAEGSSSPSLSEGSSSPSLSEGVSYAFANSFFVDTYGNYSYNQAANSYYANTHTYEGYPLLASGVPYIVRFPGEHYYEFDLSSEFYNSILGKTEKAQTLTFNAYGTEYASKKSHITETTGKKSDSAILIPITSEMGTKNVNGYSHMGTFAATNVAECRIYGMNEYGTAFNDASDIKTVMPFRTYITPASTKAKSHAAYAPAIIRIAESTGIEKINPEFGNDDDDDSGNYLYVRPISEHRVRIESTYATQLFVYNGIGQLYRILDIQPGIATYSGFQPGLYIFGRTKAMVK